MAEPQQPDPTRVPTDGIILASGSPRRRRLLTLIGLPHRVQPANVDETPRVGEKAVDYAARMAGEKAAAVALTDPGHPVLAADTVVEQDGRLLGKPESPAQARAMLTRLQGAPHKVHTAVALEFRYRQEGLVDSASVFFRQLSAAKIAWYVKTGEPMDKAGAYAIQGIGGLFIDRVDGSPQTVVGLPLHRLPGLFEAVNLDLWSMLTPKTS